MRFLPFDFGCYSCLVVSISGRLVRSYLLFLGFPTYPLLAGSSLVVCCFFTAFIMSINTPITAAATTSDNF